LLTSARRILFLSAKERKKTDNPREGWEDGTPPPHRDFSVCCERRKKERKQTRQTRDGTRTGSPPARAGFCCEKKKERKKTDNPREGWENGTPPPHRDFKERSVMREREFGC